MNLAYLLLIIAVIAIVVSISFGMNWLFLTALTWFGVPIEVNTWTVIGSMIISSFIGGVVKFNSAKS